MSKTPEEMEAFVDKVLRRPEYIETPLSIVRANTLSDGEWDYAIEDASKRIIAETFGRCEHGAKGVLPAEANARHIVHAVNTHTALLAIVEMMADPSWKYHAECGDIHDEAVAVLSQASVEATGEEDTKT